LLVRPYRLSHEHERRCRSGPASAPHQTALEKIWFWAVVGAGRAGRYLAARAGRWPPGMHTITRTRKLSHSGTRGGLTAEGLGRPFSSEPPQPPHQLCASYRPGHARRSTQHGGSNHRRPSNLNLETGATPHPKTPLRRRDYKRRLCFPPSHSSSTGLPTSPNPHPSPPHRPPRWSTPPTTLCRAETDPNSPQPTPLPANAE